MCVDNSKIKEEEMNLREQIISVDNLDKNMFVEAGAGAGKTHLIVERVVQQLRSGKYDPKDIVVITFTNKAANELLDRIIKRLSGEDDPNLKKALNTIEDMNISTIHSFCYKLLQERSFDAGLPIGVSLLEESELIALKDQYFREYMSGLEESDWSALTEFQEKNSRYFVNGDVYAIYSKICNLQQEYFDSISCPKKLLDDESVKEEVDSLIRDFFSHLMFVINNILEDDRPTMGYSDLSSYIDDGNEGGLDTFFNGELSLNDDSKTTLKDLLINPIKEENKVLILDAFYKGLKNPKCFRNSHSRTKFKKKRSKPIVDDLNSKIKEKYDEAKKIYKNKHSDDVAKRAAFENYKTAIIDGTNTMLTGLGSVTDVAQLKGLTGNKDYFNDNDSVFEIIDWFANTDNGDLSSFGDLLKNTKKVNLFKDEPKACYYSDSTVSTAHEAMFEWYINNKERLYNAINYKKERYYQKCVEYAKKAAEYYRNNKPADKIGNDDLLNYTYDMFNKKPELRRIISDRYKCFYVDEFQDTDHIQDTFIWNMALDPDQPDRLRDGALFLVGDPKQSIYRFRGAQPEVYYERRSQMEELKNNGETNTAIYSLRINFRSNKKVLGWVNEVYTRLEEESKDLSSKAPAPLMDTPYESMIWHKELKSEDKCLAGVYRACLVDKDYKVEQCASHLAKLIRALIDNQYKITEYNDVKQVCGTRKIDYSDFLVLTPNKKKMQKYLDALFKEHIPVQLDGETAPSCIHELNAYVRIYRFLSNMSNPLYRLGAKEALMVCGFCEKESEKEKESELILNSLVKHTNDMNSYCVAYELMNLLSLLTVKSESGMEKYERKSMLSKLHQMVETVTSSCSGTRSDLADAFDKYLETNVEHELSLDSKPEAVRVMNIHKAKGLEGNIVILTDRRTPPMDTFKGGIIDGVYYPGTKYWNAVKDSSTEEKYLKEGKSENRRLEYVTATRAEQVLIFMDKIGANCMFGRTDFQYFNDEDPYVDSDTIKALMELPPVSSKEGESETYLYDELHTPINETEHNQSTEKIMSPSSFEKYKVAEADNDSIAKADNALLVRPVGKDFGTQMHKMLELLVSRSWINEKIGKSVDEEKLLSFCVCQAMELPVADDVVVDPTEGDEAESKTYSPKVVQEFLTVIGKAFLQSLKTEDSILKDAEEIYTELPFSFCYDNDDGIKTWLNGEADLVVKKKDGSILLVDYKSDGDDKCTEANFVHHLLESYTPQLDEYKRMIVEVFKVDDINKIQSKLISFSQKDENGDFFKEKKVRVRCTEV